MPLPHGIRRSATGATGSPRAPCLIIHGGPTSSAARLTLKGLSYAPTGAVMAASTTSLPETPGGARNWDSRYTWIRDSAFMLRSLCRLGFRWEAIGYFAFIVGALTSGDSGTELDLQVMYGIGGERQLTERTLGHLSGYRGAARSEPATMRGTSVSTTAGKCCWTPAMLLWRQMPRPASRQPHAAAAATAA
jgi:Glycosyl hydrolases family 15